MAKACVVVGVGPGIGFHVAARFLKEGYKVGLCSRNQTRLKDTKAALLAEVEGRGVVEIAAADAAKPEDLRQAIVNLASTLGDVEVLVYNAAALRPGLPSQLGAEHLVREFRVNVAGALVAAQAVKTDMAAAGTGTILFTGGGLALHPAPSMASLSIGKAGIRTLALMLSEELQPLGIHVATVTVDGLVGADGLAPATIANTYVDLVAQTAGPAAQWDREIVLSTR